MDRWDSGVAPDVIGPGFVGNLENMFPQNSTVDIFLDSGLRGLNIGKQA